MSVTAAEVAPRDGRITKLWDVTATADADVTISIAHGMEAAPEIVQISWLNAAARVSQWLYTVDATSINLFKTTGVGSGSAQPQIRVLATRRVTANA